MVGIWRRPQKRILTQTQYYARLMIRKDTLRDPLCYEQPNKYSAAFTRPYPSRAGESSGSPLHNFKVLLDPHREEWLAFQRKTKYMYGLCGSRACCERGSSIALHAGSSFVCGQSLPGVLSAPVTSETTSALVASPSSPLRAGPRGGRLVVSHHQTQ